MNRKQSDDSGQIEQKKASLFQVARAVVWGFFGVRKHKNWQEDSATITPVQAIIGGVIGAAIFVFVLIMIVRFVTK